MPSEEIEKFRIIESRKNYESADQWLRNFKEATWDEARTYVRFYCPPDEDMLIAFAQFREWEARGLRPHEVITDEGIPLEDWLSYGMAKFRGSLDYLSLVGSTIRPLGYTESLTWGILSGDYFLAPFFENGTSGGFLTITGRPRMGKSGIACLYAEMWLERWPETEVLTNVPLEKNVAGVQAISHILHLLRRIAEALKAERRWLWEYDEPSLSRWMKTDAPSGRAKDLERFARIIPKLGGSFVYIEQREEGVPSTIADFAQSHIYCTNPGSVFADLPKKRGPITHVPKPRKVRYRTGEAGYFEVPADFPWDKLFRALRFDPFMNTIEAVDAPTQGDRIERFLNELEATKPKSARPPVSCRFCGWSWIPRLDETPSRCPKCDKRNPIRESGEAPFEADAGNASAAQPQPPSFDLTPDPPPPSNA